MLRSEARFGVYSSSFALPSMGSGPAAYRCLLPSCARAACSQKVRCRMRHRGVANQAEELAHAVLHVDLRTWLTKSLARIGDCGRTGRMQL